VLKLQVFLRTYEGFSNVPTSGFYDKVTEEAVRAFQVRYGQDVLNPWGLGAMEPTGYVFITTTYAINQIYCNRTTANNFDLRQVYPNSGTVSGVKDGGQIGNIDHGFIASTTACRTLESAANSKQQITKLSGTTDLFIQENYQFKFASGIITNFHVPKSSLLMLVSAFTTRDKLMQIYNKPSKKNIAFFHSATAC
jgi:hypothetical protein